MSRLLSEGRREAAEELLAALREAFPDRLAVELHRHGLEVERAIEPALLGMADELGLPIVAANDVYFAKPEMHEAHDALLCIAEGRLLAEPEPPPGDAGALVQAGRRDMRALFADLPEACDNTLAIARRCAVMTEARKPELPLCPKVQPGMTEAETVRDMARRGLDRPARRGRHAEQAAREPYEQRLDYELGVIEQMGFAGYFLIVADFIQWAKAQGIPVGPGRGSGAGSRRRLGAHHHRPRPDAIRPALRALPEPRARLDAGHRHRLLPGPARRGDPLRRARSTAPTGVAQIITFGKLQAKAAVRDVGRVLGMPYGQVDRIA